MRLTTTALATMADNDIITSGELADSITRLTAAGEFLTPWPHLVARLIVDDVGKHREPEEPGYEDGAVYQDAYGEVWQYTDVPEDDCPWRSFTDHPVQFHVPKRPLRKLVPEKEPAGLAGEVSQSRHGPSGAPARTLPSSATARWS
jgi:hypothetical protein